MKINTQRQKNALFPARYLFFAAIFGFICGLFAAAWWHLAHLNHRVSTERNTLIQYQPHNERKN